MIVLVFDYSFVWLPVLVLVLVPADILVWVLGYIVAWVLLYIFAWVQIYTQCYTTVLGLACTIVMARVLEFFRVPIISTWFRILIFGGSKISKNLTPWFMDDLFQSAEIFFCDCNV